MLQGVPSNARQQWTEAYTVVGHKVLDAYANEQGAGVCADVLQAVQAVQEFGAIPRKVFRVQPRPPLGGRSSSEGDPDSGRVAPGGRRGGGRTLTQRGAAASASGRCAAAGCVDRSMPSSQALNPPLRAAHPAAAPAAPLEATEPALQLTRAQLQEVVAIVSAHQLRTAARPSGWTFEMIYTACQSSDAALDVTLELVNPILSGELPWAAFLLDVLLIGLEKPGGGVQPIVISET